MLSAYASSPRRCIYSKIILINIVCSNMFVLNLIVIDSSRYRYTYKELSMVYENDPFESRRSLIIISLIELYEKQAIKAASST